MAQRCDVCGKGPAVGHKISHAHNVTKRRWLPNLASLRAMVGGHGQAPAASARAASRPARSPRSSKVGEKGATGGVYHPPPSLVKPET